MQEGGEEVGDAHLERVTIDNSILDVLEAYKTSKCMFSRQLET